MAGSKNSGKNMVNVQVDGNWIRVPSGTRMIEACKQGTLNFKAYITTCRLTL